MHEKYCLPIVKHSCQEVFKEIEQNLKHYQFFEIWLDYIDDVDEEFIKKLSEKYQQKIILLFRRESLDPIEMPTDNRFHLMQSLDNSSTLLDLDIKTQRAEFEFMKLNSLQIRIIGSYHNYKKTPDMMELGLIAEEISSHNPEIVKISTFCNDESDAVRLLQLQLMLKDQNLNHIVLGMGEHGVITRVYGSLWGNALIFAPITEHHHTAPGQFTRSQYETIFKLLQ
jgi:3-dehydroquinate dehydratase type I